MLLKNFDKTVLKVTTCYNTPATPIEWLMRGKTITSFIENTTNELSHYNIHNQCFAAVICSSGRYLPFNKSIHSLYDNFASVFIVEAGGFVGGTASPSLPFAFCCAS